MAAHFVSNFSPAAEQKHQRVILRSETDGKLPRLNVALNETDPATKSLLIWNAGKFDSSLLARFKQLERLTVFCWSDTTLDALAAVPHVRELALMNIGKVSTFAPLAHLRELHRLELMTLTSSTTPQTIESLDPLGELSKLEYLVACDFWPQDRSIAAFDQLAPLKYLSLTNWLTLPQRAHVAARGHPIQDPVLEVGIPCSKCDGLRTLLYGIESRRKWYCSKCHPEVIATHRADYTQLLATAKAKLGKWE